MAYLIMVQSVDDYDIGLPIQQSIGRKHSYALSPQTGVTTIGVLIPDFLRHQEEFTPPDFAVCYGAFPTISILLGY